MTHPTPNRPDPPLRRRAAEHAFGLIVLAEQLEATAATWQNLTTTSDPDSRHLADVELSRLRAVAARLDAIAVEIAALPAAAGIGILTRGDLADRLRLAARNTLTPDSARLPAPPAIIAEVAEDVRRVADALLDPASATPDPPVTPDPPTTLDSPPAGQSCRVEVTASRLILTPPCCPAAPIILPRAKVDPLTLTCLGCSPCGRVYDVALLGGPDDGLWICWRERSRRDHTRPDRTGPDRTGPDHDRPRLPT